MRVPQRGRALVRRLSTHESVRAFRPGDFVLTVSDGALARLQGWATAADINHAALIVDPLGGLVEANPQLTGDSRAVRSASVADYVRSGQPCWIGYVELREGTRQDVVTFAEHLLRSHTPQSAFARCLLVAHTIFCVGPRALTARVRWLGPVHHFVDRHAITVHAEHSYLSGELVARALERGGFVWDRDPSHVTPQDLFLRYHFADETIVLQPTSLAHERGRRRRAGSRASAGPRTGAITPFAPRSTSGANALAEQPSALNTPEVGMRTLLQLGIFMAAGLAVIGVIEELARTGGN